MIGVIAKLTVKSGMEAEFEKQAAILAEKVNANEAGCTLYKLGNYIAIYTKQSNKEGLYQFVFDYFLSLVLNLRACFNFLSKLLIEPLSLSASP